MNWQQCWNASKTWGIHVLQQVEIALKAWIKPAPNHQITGVITDLFCGKQELIVENAFLRQQLIILKREQTTRLPITQRDRCILVVLASKLCGWKSALHIVKPDTLLKWHRQGFRLFWRWKSKSQTRSLRIAPEIIALIKEMALANRLWGSRRIRDELRKLGITVSKRTVQKYMRQVRRDMPPQHQSQTWATFLANHADEIWACDFVQTYDLFFRTIFIFFMVELGSRRVVHFGVTRSPSDGWVTQQLRDATPFGEGPRFLICDNDGKFGAQFERVAKGSGIDVIHTPVAAPQANAICERFIGSVRRELLDHILILGERKLQRKVKAYVHYFNYARPHQGIDGQLPIPLASSPPISPHLFRLQRIPVLGGLHHDYRWAA